MNRKNILPLISLALCLALASAFYSFVSAQTGAAAVTFNPQNAAASIESVSEVGIEIQNVTNLYAFDITVSYDPAFVEVVDSDPITPGIQVAQGTFLASGIVVMNQVDSANGTIRYVMTQMNPSEPKSGTGLLLVIRVRGKQAGQSALKVGAVQLATRSGTEILSTSVAGSITVSATAPTGPTATSLPTSGPQVQITLSASTDSPTEIPTSGSQVTATPPAPTASALSNPTSTLQATAFAQPTNGVTKPTLAPTQPAPTLTELPVAAAPAPQPTSQSTPGNNWIIIGIAAVIVAVLFFIWLRTRKP